MEDMLVSLCRREGPHREDTVALGMSSPPGPTQSPSPLLFTTLWWEPSQIMDTPSLPKRKEEEVHSGRIYREGLAYTLWGL